MRRQCMNLCCAETLAGMEALNLAAPFKVGKAGRKKKKKNNDVYEALAGMEVFNLAAPFKVGKAGRKEKKIKEETFAGTPDPPGGPQTRGPHV